MSDQRAKSWIAKGAESVVVTWGPPRGKVASPLGPAKYGIRTATFARGIYAPVVKALGQFCSIARALDVLGERWSLLVVREILCGSHRFGDIRRGIPRISRTMLSARLRELVDAGVLARTAGDGGPIYELTQAGRELETVVRDLGVWGQRWLPRSLPREELDVDTLLWDVRRRIRVDALPRTPMVARIELSDVRGRAGVRFLLLRRNEVSLCAENPGFPDELCIRGSLRTLTAWWRGDFSLEDARAAGMTIEGRREWVRAFPAWFLRYAFADVAPARR
jgi:DNA-binding HxlR family transcriptional regulator